MELVPHASAGMSCKQSKVQPYSRTEALGTTCKTSLRTGARSERAHTLRLASLPVRCSGQVNEAENQRTEDRSLGTGQGLGRDRSRDCFRVASGERRVGWGS